MGLERFKKITVPRHLIVPLILTAMNVVAIASVARWSVVIADEQAELRRDYLELSNAQEQLNIQFEYWLAKTQTQKGGE